MRRARRFGKPCPTWTTLDELNFIRSLNPQALAGYVAGLHHRTRWGGLDEDAVWLVAARCVRGFGGVTA